MAQSGRRHSARSSDAPVRHFGTARTSLVPRRGLRSGTKHAETIPETRERGSRKKRKREEDTACVFSGIDRLERRAGRTRTRREPRSARETGCGQLFTSWRMIHRGVALQNASSWCLSRWLPTASCENTRATGERMLVLTENCVIF